MTTLFRTEDLMVNFGGLQAVDGVSVTVDYGQLIGLIGANGAGKTTFIDAVTGFVDSSGRILLEERNLCGLRPHRRSRAGIGRTWQAQELFTDLTVYENVQVAAERLSIRESAVDLLRPRRTRPLPAVEAALDRLELAHLADRMPGDLSQADRKLVGVARALAGEPKLICMDEPAAGLGTADSQQLGHRLREVVADGVAILLVDHDMSLVLSVCDHVYVVEFGRVIAEGAPAHVRRDARVIASYLGETASRVGTPA